MLDLLYIIFIVIEILAVINIPVLLLLEISHQDYNDGMKFLITVVIGAIVSFIIYEDSYTKFILTGVFYGELAALTTYFMNYLFFYIKDRKERREKTPYERFKDLYK
jgi:hypothetical protein